MKRLGNLRIMLAFLIVSFFVACDSGYDFDAGEPTRQIDSIELSAKAYPGVNVLVWKNIKDASGYTIYKSSDDGAIEEEVLSASAQTSYYDVNIEEGISYKYRIVAIPADKMLHDASQKTVTVTTAKTATGDNLKGTWAPNATTFLDLAKYENDYDSNEAVLSEDTITSKLLVTSSGTVVRVTFPVKPYAQYDIKISQPGGAVLNDSSAYEGNKTIFGANYNKTASIDMTALYSGEKEITVTATPLNGIYRSSTVVSASKVTVYDYNDISSAILDGSLMAEWLTYNASTSRATARISFSPYKYNGEEFRPSEYTIYRAIISSNSETGIATNAEGNTLSAFSSVTNLGSPEKDDSSSTSTNSMYYLNDLPINLEAEAVDSVKYYVILNHDGKIKSTSTILSASSVPKSTSSSDWNVSVDSHTVLIKDSDTGLPIRNAEIKVLDGNNCVVTTILTDNSGMAKLNDTTLTDGSYTFIITRNGYIQTKDTLDISDGGIKSGNLISIPQESSENCIRIILDWSDTPHDLDAHLKMGENHIYYSNKSSDNGNMQLDRDDTDSYGPETVTIKNVSTTSTYKYFVHNFSKNSDRGLSASQARVRVYINNEYKKTYTVPDGIGMYWNVFTITDGSVITDVNVITSVEPD